ncbi:MAG: C39 family peptidase [Chloroflexi bacterium]|nr:C39 family peptidase [Chloroflexota bacterium]
MELHITPRQVRGRLAGATSAALLIALALASPASAAKPIYDDSGRPRVGTYDPDDPAPLKLRLLELHERQRAGKMTAPEADEWNHLIAANGLDPIGRLQPAAASSGSMTPMSLYVSKILAGTQRPQLKGYWCGPATAQSIILGWHNEKGNPTASDLDGKALSQANLALSTYTNVEQDKGTDWIDKDMLRALNRWLDTGGADYYQVTPTSVGALEGYVTLDVDIDWMLASDMVEAAGGAHYNHHPAARTIYHWTSIRGYADSGDTFSFQDPAANTSVLPADWDGAAAYFSLSSTSAYNFMTKVRTRGVAW